MFIACNVEFRPYLWSRVSCISSSCADIGDIGYFFYIVTVDCEDTISRKTSEFQDIRENFCGNSADRRKDIAHQRNLVKLGVSLACDFGYLSLVCTFQLLLLFVEALHLDISFEQTRSKKVCFARVESNLSIQA